VKLSRLAAAASAGVLVLAGCGNSESLGAGDDATTAPASETTSEEPTDEPAEEPTSQATEEPTTDATEGAEGTELTEATMVQVVTDAQLEAGTAQMDMSIDVAGQSITMTGALQAAATLEESAMRAEMEIPGQGTIQMILIDSVLYMNLGPATGDKFFELRLDDPSAEAFLGQLKSQLNPAEAIKALEGAVTGFEAAGTETVDGQETTKYVLQVDTQKVLARQGTPLPPGVDVPDTLDYTFWLNADNLPVKIAVEMGALGTIEMNFTGWGEPVDIAAPPANQITEQNPLTPAA